MAAIVSMRDDAILDPDRRPDAPREIDYDAPTFAYAKPTLRLAPRGLWICSNGRNIVSRMTNMRDTYSLQFQIMPLFFLMYSKLRLPD